MRRLLVTGGAGFVGANFVRHLVERTEAEITVLDKLTYAASPEALDGLPQERVRLVVGDVANPDLVEELVAGQDAVVHFAAESHNDNALHEPADFVHTNLLGTFAVLEAVRRHGVRLHHVSTDEVYGDLAGRPGSRFTEESAYLPSTPYSATKAGADHLVRAWVRSFGIAATVSNCSNNYGPWQHIEKFIPRSITNVLTGRRPKVHGKGEHVRDWIHVDDHSAAVWAILTRGTPGETYLVGADGERDNLALVQALLRLMGEPEDAFDLVPDRPGNDLRYAIDASRLRSELGWAPGHADLEAGLAEAIGWYRDNDAWWRPHKDAVEEWYAARGQA
jgi:dTDP-glucose 4,6-dehydratase